MGIVIAIILFSLIIIFHELGHFTLAKINKIRVDEFSLGLGPTLIGKKIGGTFFCLKLLPFGGAWVKMMRTICQRAALTANLCGPECLSLRQVLFSI